MVLNLSKISLLRCLPLWLLNTSQNERIVQRRWVLPRDSIKKFSCAFDTTPPNIERTGIRLCIHLPMLSTRIYTTSPTLFSLFLSQKPPGPNSFQCNDEILSDAHGELSSQALNARLDAHIQTFADSCSRPCEEVPTAVQIKLWTPCKRESNLQTGWLWISWSISAWNKQNSRCTPIRQWHTLQALSAQHKAVLHCPRSSITVVIEIYGMKNIVTIHRAVDPPAMPRHLPTGSSTPLCNSNDHCQEEEIPRERSNEITFDQKYAFDHIVRHVGKGTETKTVVRWYKYAPVEDTIERTEHIPKHFITRYLKRVKKHKRSQYICALRESEVQNNKII